MVPTWTETCRSVYSNLILILFRVDAASNVHWLDFNKEILILEMHGTKIKIKKKSNNNIYCKKRRLCLSACNVIWQYKEDAPRHSLLPACFCISLLLVSIILGQQTLHHSDVNFIRASRARQTSSQTFCDVQTVYRGASMGVVSNIGLSEEFI
jgi:hypothetical protein